MVLLLTWMLACHGGPETVAPPPSPEDASVAVRQGIQAAHRAWSGGQLDVAQATVMDTYRARFEPLEPALRTVNPRETLELEYAFAQLSSHLSRKGSPVEVASEVRALVDRVDRAIAALPVPANAPPKPQAPAPTTSTTSTMVVPEAGAAAAAVPGASSDKDPAGG